MGRCSYKLNQVLQHVNHPNLKVVYLGHSKKPGCFVGFELGQTKRVDLDNWFLKNFELEPVAKYALIDVNNDLVLSTESDWNEARKEVGRKRKLGRNVRIYKLTEG